MYILLFPIPVFLYAQKAINGFTLWLIEANIKTRKFQLFVSQYIYHGASFCLWECVNATLMDSLGES